MLISTSTLQIRSATENDLVDIAALHVSSWQTAYKGVVPDELLASRDIKSSLENWRSTFSSYPENISVALSYGEQLVGFCCSGPVVDTDRNSPFNFEIYGLHVDPSYYRQGIGTALMTNSFDRMKCLGLSDAIVWTLEDLIQSRFFYEKNGGKLVKTGAWKVGGYTLKEVAYGWWAHKAV